MIKAIQTTYAGHRFRSRLEARWAIVFNAMGIAWQYECEGFHVKNWKYLPDFYLPESRMWVEVKGDWAAETDDYFEMLFAISCNDSSLPHMRGSANSEFGGLLLLGPIPSESKWSPPFLALFNDSADNSPHMNRVLLSPQFEMVPYSSWMSTIDSGGAIKNRLLENGSTSRVPNTSEKAFRIARQARFEFGETPKC